jgi:hypothetical protein
MRVTVAHNKTEQQVKDAVDHSMDQVFSAVAVGVVEFSDQHRHWHGNIMSFSLTARMGFIKTPIKGTVEVRPGELMIDVDLGVLENLIQQNTLRSSLENKVRGLLA